MTANPHLDQRVEYYGAPLNDASEVAIVLHGRSQDPEWMNDHLLAQLNLPGIAFVAPAATDNTWYAAGFMSPTADNQPHLDWALERVRTLIDELSVSGRPLHLIGFSQGACLTAQTLAIDPSPITSAVVLTGGLIGPPGTTWDMPTASHLRCLMTTSDIDEWVPLPRAEETRVIFEDHGVDVDWTLYHGRPHEICADEIARVDAFLKN